MMTRDGEAVHVVYPGISAGNFGPDYRDAVVAFGERSQVAGDVELHLCGEDWHRHGHDADVAYDRVILHVVARERAAAARCIAGGCDVPEVVLEDADQVRAASFLPCALRSEPDAVNVRRHLARAGRARMLIRAARIADRPIRSAPWEPLAHGVARALGYAANADASMELGRRLTDVRSDLWLSDGDDNYREVLTVGVAGLLPSQRKGTVLPPCELALEWETRWRRLELGVASMDAHQWRINGLYPNNSPVRRAVALADLWPSIRQVADLASGLILGGGARARLCASTLEARFRLSGSVYWGRHYDFGLCTRESDLIGGSKAREIVINALLPWVASTALTAGDSQLLDAAVRLLGEYPPASPNAVTRHMERQLNLSRGGANAAEQQGMLHLFREYCRHGRCDACVLGGLWQLREVNSSSNHTDSSLAVVV